MVAPLTCRVDFLVPVLHHSLWLRKLGIVLVISCWRWIRVFAENLVGLGFLLSVSYIKPSPTHEKYLLWEKVTQLPLLTYFFSG